MEMLLDWRSVGSLVATVMVLRTAIRDFIPPEAEHWLRRLLARVAAAFRADAGAPNDLYDDAQLYLGARSLAAAPAVRLYKPHQAHRPVASLPDAHTAHDTFKGVRVKWTSTARPVGRNIYGGRGSGGGDHRSLELQFPQQHRDFVHDSYIPHVIEEATRMRLKSRDRRLYTNRAAEAEDLLAADVRITPADIGEVFMGCDSVGASAALRRLVSELHRRRDTPVVDTVELGALTE